TAEQEVLRSVNLLQQAQEEAAQLQVLLSDKRAHLEHLEETQHGLLLGLERVQGKLGYASEDGLALLRENQALLRGRGSAVRVLRSDAGLAEARVQALREAVGEAEGNLGRMRLSEVLENENAEMRELHELQRQLHEHQQNQALGRGAWDSHSHSLDLLSHSHSQEGQDQRGMGGAALDSDCDNNTDDNNNTENNEAETLLSLGIGEGESGVQGVGEVRGGGVERGGGAGSSSSSEASSGPRSSPVHTMGGGRALADEAEGAGEGGDGDGDEEGSSIHDSDDENDTDNVDEGEFQDSGTEGSISVLQML
ncbi:hypothetical protein B484DRAFT_437798, partial [Ochromonadaceae sp. CCMP2298]